MSSEARMRACRRTARAGLAAGVAALAAGCGPGRPADVLLITVDTLRADHLGVYDTGSSTPGIDAFARDATVFEGATAPMPLTRPSHFSMLTGRYPREHGVVNNATSLPGTARTLAERLAERGYRTAAFVGVRLLDPESGAAQGFETYDHPIDARERRADAVVWKALAWLDGIAPDDRFLLWVHLFDPHLPYAPPPGFREGVPPERPELDWPQLEGIARDHGGDLPAAVLEEERRLYRGEVAWVDRWVAELIAAVASRRPLDEALVVLTADHGECFENGIYFEHSDCLWQPGIRIPLIVRHPPEFAGGRRVAATASILDVTPTVLRAAGIELPEGLSGRPLQEHASFGDRHVLVQYPLYQKLAARNRLRRLDAIRSVAGQPTRRVLLDEERVGVVGPEWKYLRTGDRGELYRIAPVSGEPRDEIDARPEVAARMEALLDGMLAEHPLTLIEPAVINDELRETLEALGYL